MALKLNGSTDGSVALDAPADTSPSGTDVTLTLPTSAGSSGQYLQTNGSGTLSWQTVAAGNIPYFATEMVSNVAITHNTETEFTAYTTEVADTGSAFASGRFTPQTAGKYLIIAQSCPQYDQKSISSSLVLRKNGSTKLAEAKHRITGNTSHYSHALAVVADMNGSTDYVSLFMYQYNYTDSTSINFDFNIIQGFRLGD